METRIFSGAMDEAAEIIKNGGLVAVPTETVYGLTGNGLDESAVKNIYEVKGRPAVKPLSLMVPGAEAMDEYCEDVPGAARVLAAKFWPGPLTIVLKAKGFIPSIVLAGGSTVGLRCPQHELTLELLNKAKCPLAAPSANPSGEPSPKTAQKVLEYFEGKIDAVIDGGECGIGRESTIIDLSREPYRILRLGALGEDEVADALVGGMTVIGITGGSGGGKTTALEVLADMGALVLDADRIYHELLESSEAMLAELRAAFPAAAADGAIDRKALAAIVFNDADALDTLNAITHKYVNAEMKGRLRAFAMAGGRLAAIDAIGLLSATAGQNYTATVAVTAPEEARVARIMARDGISRERAVERIGAQQPDAYFVNNCDYTLCNDGTAEAFAEKCRKLFKEIAENGRD